MTTEETKAWIELWEFANSSIRVADGLIDREEFIEQGKKRFGLAPADSEVPYDIVEQARVYINWGDGFDSGGFYDYLQENFYIIPKPETE